MVGKISEGSPVVTADGSHTMMHPQLEEAFHSRLGARREAEELYIKASGFSQAVEVAQSVSVLDVGLGLGYNAFSTLHNWAQANTAADLNMSSLEVDRDLIEALISGSAPWQQNWPSSWLGVCHQIQSSGEDCWVAEVRHPNTAAIARWRIFCVNAESVSVSHEAFRWCDPFDFVWQDPFSPKSNPNMWRAQWFSILKAACKSSAVLMTYSVARVVKDGLNHGGWNYNLIPGAGEKRQWMRAIPAPSTSETTTD